MLVWKHNRFLRHWPGRAFATRQSHQPSAPPTATWQWNFHAVDFSTWQRAKLVDPHSVGYQTQPPDSACAINGRLSSIR
jgi:hypothetical protein